MISVAEARTRILSAVRPTPVEWVALTAAIGRTLAQAVTARLTQPPADLSAMDGYAARAIDVASVPVRLKLIGRAAAGHAFAGRVGPGEAVRIFTGAPVPAGADTIVIQENAETFGADTVLVSETAAAGRHIRPRGNDFAQGDALLKPGTRLSAPAIALAAAGNVPWLAVHRRPRVAILATGDELVRPGEPRGESQIISSNSAGLAALVTAAGGVPLDLGIAPDRPEAIAAAAGAARGADFFVTIGGASVGEHDLVQAALREVGVTIDFWKIAMRPGKPLVFGRAGETPFLGLPGNPVSALVCGLLFLRPALLAAQSLPPELPEGHATLAGALPANDKRADFLRARFEIGSDGALRAIPFSVQDSAMLSALAATDALIVRPPHTPAASSGSEVRVIPLAGLW